MGPGAVGVAVLVTADLVVVGVGVLVHPAAGRAITTAVTALADRTDTRATM
jgi:hypothetical protein